MRLDCSVASIIIFSNLSLFIFLTIVLSNIIGINKDHFEQLQVVRYQPGQLYREHWDACWEEDKCQELVKRGGNRYATFLLY